MDTWWRVLASWISNTWVIWGALLIMPFLLHGGALAVVVLSVTLVASSVFAQAFWRQMWSSSGCRATHRFISPLVGVATLSVLALSGVADKVFEYAVVEHPLIACALAALTVGATVSLVARLLHLPTQLWIAGGLLVVVGALYVSSVCLARSAYGLSAVLQFVLGPIAFACVVSTAAGAGEAVAQAMAGWS